MNILASSVTLSTVEFEIDLFSDCLFVLTVTPIDRLHDGDGSNGVKGAAEEGKL